MDMPNIVSAKATIRSICAARSTTAASTENRLANGVAKTSSTRPMPVERIAPIQVARKP